PFTPWPDRDPSMAAAAAALGERLQISRARAEAWATDSHAKAMGDPSAEIVPLLGVTRDPFARRLTPALLARAPVVAGDVTAATAAVAADGAAICLVVSERVARGRGLALVAGVTLGADPEEPGLAPLAAIRRIWGGEALQMVEEIMEAYAVQAIAVVDEAGIDPRIVNPGGGALARGHPIGASGAILAVRLFHGLRQGRGLAAIASAGGIGTALLLDSAPGKE
ncbi:MAG: acetyl-CoA acetyltransferase, partial [Rhodobacterales bacterium 12-65-15]